MPPSFRQALSAPKIAQLLFIISAFFALTKIYLSNLTTLSGYEIGRLKEHENQLLKKRSLLTMQLTTMMRKRKLIKNIKP